MSKYFGAPGFVFWPVGNGDSTSIVVTDEIVMQIDLHHMCKSNDEDDACHPIVDLLYDNLPKREGKPHLSVLCITHLDKDHCQGFTDLLDRVTIDEIWFTPRVLDDEDDALCEDAVAFKEEAIRRVKKAIKEGLHLDAGDRVRILGWADLLLEDDYEGFPSELFSVAGSTISTMAGEDVSEVFRAFVHAPFKDDMDGDRNETSIALQVQLKDGDAHCCGLFFGDLNYPVLKKIFEHTADKQFLEWNVLSTPHHCSKSAMYWRDSRDSEETLRKDILDALSEVALSPGYIVSSSEKIPVRNSSGDNPPHAKAKARYEEIVPDKFLCTHEHPNEDNPEPIEFKFEDGTLTYDEPANDDKSVDRSISASISILQSSNTPQSHRVEFG
ncbi:MAG: hypothetical protein SFY67_11960 [Candidatus Melainabacteria bacterium]|nr:hypothetical protein [Candidatus Melainabacteria bacterium]